MIASATGENRVEGGREHRVLALMRTTQRPREIWIIGCSTGDLESKHCEEVVKRFRFLRSLDAP